MKKYTVGVDVGGTNVKFGLIDPSGAVLHRNRLVTKSYGSDKNRLIKALAEGVLGLIAASGISKAQVAGVGIGLPGLVNPKDGLVIFLPNIPGWRNVPLKAKLEKYLGLPVYLENDVNLITLGEWGFGAGRGCCNMIGMTLGTGVGAGLILDGKLYRGEGFAAGELGHMPINFEGPRCNCGSFACFETFVGNGRLQRMAEEKFQRPGIALEDVFQLAKTGNVKALRFWQETGETIGTGLIGAVNLLNPTHIVIGGGVSRSHQFLFPAIRRTIKARAMAVQGRMVKIVRARLGDDAGIIGAQILVNQEQQAK